jgi:sterol desaturase/sphingolipid hydroxylase (fatty acid hydroxylase superfamily)
MKSRVTTEHRKGQAQIFKNPLLERLTKTDLKSNIIFYGLVGALLVYYALFVQHIAFLTFMLVFAAGLFFWTLAEYGLHRYLFHWVNDNELSKRFHFIIHGAHHLYPNDEERLLMPPLPGMILATIFFSIFYVLFSILGVVFYLWAFFPGFFIGYLLYSFLHRAIHIIKPPKGFEHIWKHHIFHHYKYPDKAFGVSTHLWDRLFGTMPPER